MTRISLVFLVFLLSACVADEPTPDQNDGVQTTAASLDEGSLAAVGVLAWLNGPDATFETLDIEVGLYANTARNIVSHVRGADGALGTRDDNPIDSVAELDAIPKVGPRAIENILTHVRSLGGIPSEVVEGIALTDEQIIGVLEVANHYSFESLDVTVGLDKRAAQGIVERRPFGDVETLAAVPYVGGAAIRALRDRAELDQPGSEDIVIEGVRFTQPQAQQALEVANLATLKQLDDDAELDARAARNIIAARELGSLQELAGVSYVGKTALAKIRAYIPRFTPPVVEDVLVAEGGDCAETSDCEGDLYCGGIPFDGSPAIGKCIDGNLDTPGYWDECGRHQACNDGLECIGTTAFGGEGWCAYPWMLGTYETRGSLEIPDGDDAGVSMDVVVYGQASVPMDILVTLYIDHPNPEDLVVTLISTNGSDSVLWNHDGSPDYRLPANGIERDNYINGTLTLHVADTVSGNTGTLNGFKLLVSSRYD